MADRQYNKEDSVSLRGPEEALLETTATLADREALLRAIIDAATDGIITIDAHGVIETFNPAAQRIFGYRPDEVVGRNVSMLMPEPYRSEHDGYLADYLATGDAQVIGIGREATGRRRDGSTFPLELAVSEMQIRGQTMFCGLIRDITAGKQAQRELQRRTADLETRNREMEDFVCTVSHDLKSPLVTLSGFAEHIRRDVDAGRIDRLPMFALRIHEATARMKKIIDDLLNISRIGRVADPGEEIDVGQLVRETLRTQAAGIAAAHVVVEVAGDLPTLCVGRRGLEQVFDNLISNALKYGCGNADPHITIGWQMGDAEVRFFVRDNGEGIEPAYHQRVFGLFQRLRLDTEGTGVGLSLVKRSMQVQAGRAWVESASGQGATFWIAFPMDALVRPALGLPGHVDENEEANGRSAVALAAGR